MTFKDWYGFNQKYLHAVKFKVVIVRRSNDDSYHNFILKDNSMLVQDALDLFGDLEIKEFMPIALSEYEAMIEVTLIK